MWGNFLVPIPGEVPRARCSRPLDAVRGNSLGSRAGDPPRARLAGLPTICAGKLLGLRSREASPRVWRRVGITRGADPWCPRPGKLPARAVASAQRLSGETHWPGAPRNRPSESTWMRGTCPLGCGSARDDRPGSVGLGRPPRLGIGRSIRGASAQRGALGRQGDAPPSTSRTAIPRSDSDACVGDAPRGLLMS